jgi:peptidoglycan hydrolase-like protein with peptidoglycan-binding domain
LNKILAPGPGSEFGVTVDGMYGSQTREAVRKFQEQNGLQIDGVAGPITKQKIHEVLKKD